MEEAKSTQNLVQIVEIHLFYMKNRAIVERDQNHLRCIARFTAQ